MGAAQTITISKDLGSGVSATGTVYLIHAQTGEWKLKSAYFLPDEATEASGSNLFTVQLKQGSDAVSDALTSNAGSGFVAGTAQAMTLSAAGKALEFGAEDELSIVMTETGTATMGGDVYVTFEKARV